MSRPNPAVVLLAAATFAGCAHRSRPSIETRAAMDRVVVSAAARDPAARVERGGAPGVKVALGAFGGALAGASLPLVVCSLGGRLGKEIALAGLVVCGVGVVTIGVPAFLLLEGALTAGGAAVGGSRMEKAVAGQRDALRGARSLVEAQVHEPGLREALLAGALGDGETRRQFHLAGATAPDLSSPTVQVSIVAIVLEREHDAAFRPRIDARAVLVDATGRELGRAEASVRGRAARPPSAWNSDLSETLAALAREAGAAAIADLMGTLDESADRTYGAICGLGPLTPDGTPIEGLGPTRRTVEVGSDRRTLVWEAWRPPRDALGSDGALTYELRVWRPAEDAAPLIDVAGLTQPSFALPAGVADGEALHWTVRAVVSVRGKRFMTPWSRVREERGCLPGEPERGSMLSFVLRPQQAARGADQF